MNEAEAAMIEGHEQVLLSALMDGAQQLPVVASDFSSPPNRIIFERVSALSDRCLLAVTDALRQNGELEKVGGAHRITEIFLMPHDPQNLNYALDQVLEHSRARQAAKIGEQMHKGELAPEQARDKLNEILLLPETNDLPTIEDVAEIISKPIILPASVIEGIAHRGEKVSIGGASKAFKTWILSDLAVSVATGRLWLGHFPTTRGKVLHINFELLPAYFAERLRTLADENQVTLAKDYLHVWNLRGFACDLAMLLPKILQRVGRVEYSLINLDPIYKLLGKLREENLAGDIADLLNQIEALAGKTGATVCYGAHYSKGNQANKEAIDRVAGSGVYARDPDTLVNFTRLKQDDCFSVEISFRHHHPPLKPFGVRWEYPLFTVDATLDPYDLKITGRPEKYQAKDIRALIDEPMSATEIVKLAYEELQIPRRRAFEMLAELKTAGLLKQTKKRGLYEPA